MPVLRVASLTVMALWIGGLAALVAVAAPALDPAAAAEAFGRSQRYSWVLGGCVLALLGVRAALGPRPRRLSVQLLLAAAMLVITAWPLTSMAMAVMLGLGLTLFWIESWD